MGPGRLPAAVDVGLQRIGQIRGASRHAGPAHAQRVCQAIGHLIERQDIAKADLPLLKHPAGGAAHIPIEVAQRQTIGFSVDAQLCVGADGAAGPVIGIKFEMPGVGVMCRGSVGPESLAVKSSTAARPCKPLNTPSGANMRAMVSKSRSSTAIPYREISSANCWRSSKRRSLCASSSRSVSLMAVYSRALRWVSVRPTTNAPREPDSHRSDRPAPATTGAAMSDTKTPSPRIARTLLSRTSHARPTS